MPRPYVSSDAVWNEMRRIQALSSELSELARVVGHSFEQLHEASLSPLNTSQANDGAPPPGKHGFRPSDPTGDVATSGLHFRMRREVRKVASKLRKIRPILEEAEDMLNEGHSIMDPEFAAKLTRLRELEAAAVGEGSSRAQA